MHTLTGKVALVTGASRGIGRAAAEALARAGCAVAINYRADQAGAEACLAAIEATGGRASLWPADISQLPAVEQLVAGVETQLGPIDVLVNNAAAFNRDPFLSVEPADLERVWSTNVRGPFRLSQLVARRMAGRRRGSVIHLSSIGARLAVASRSAYLLTKGALEALTRAMALDLAPFRIRVNAVAPGLVRTEGLLDGMPDAERQAQLQAYIPWGRFGEPDEIANVIVFLASDASEYVHGTVIHVDGGLGAREAGFPYT